MKKSMSNHLFYPFMGLIGVILAVLGLVLGQLFPFFIEMYLEESSSIQIEAEHLAHIEMRVAFVLFFILFITYVLIGVVTKKMLENFIDPIENIIRTAQELSIGNYQARAFANGPKTVIALRNSINLLASNLQDISKTRVIEEERLKTLIENMGSALLMIDRSGEVSIVNQTFLQYFGYAYEEVIGKNFLSLQLPEELEKFIDHVFLTELPYRRQLNIELEQELVNKMTYGAPVVGEHGRWLGVVIVLHDITELIRLEQIRKDFVANVSHELRTPITSIKGFSETLLDGAFKDEATLLSFLEIIYQESNRLQMLIQDLLELSKIEQHGFTVNLAPANIKDVLVHVLELTNQRLQEKEMVLVNEQCDDVIVQGDVNRLIQIFTNLIFNAITYSPPNTTLTVQVYTKEKFAVVDIIDQGIGIEKAEIPRIFERFYRVDKARSRNSGGTGLGLAIVKHLVEAHHGKIYVESEVGKGTTMRVMLPLSKN